MADQKTNTLLFEYPLKEQIRSFLRLESLFNQFQRNVLAVHQDNHYHALNLFFDILEILERGDTRSELIKELARLSAQFEQLRNLSEVDSNKLENFLKQIKQLHQWVLKYEGKFGDKLRKDPFIDSVRHRTSIPGGACQFDSPELFLFLNLNTKERQKQMHDWLEEIKGVKTSIDVILKIMRDNGTWKNQTAPMGSYMLDTTEVTYQLLRIKLPQNSQTFPEISCGKHRSNIQFMRFNDQYKKIPFQKPVNFELASCQ